MREKGLLTKFFDREKKQYDFEDIDGYRFIVTIYFFIHVVLEVLYILCGCTPMAIWNILSILLYLGQIIYSKTKNANPVALVWLTNLEVYSHAVLATVFMGYGCGFFYWIFGLVIAIIIPYITPMRTKLQRKVAFWFTVVLSITLIALPILNYLKVFPAKYNAPEVVQAILNCINTTVFCVAAFLYISVPIIRSERKKQQLNEAADTDYLTRLYNRQHMQNILYQIMPGQNEVCVAIMDIDHFKNINDTYGHMAGDYVLKEISQMLYKTMDEHFTVGRWGGEEFLFIAESGYSFEEFCDRLETLRKEISEFEFVFSGSSISVTASFGASRYSEGMSKEDLVKLADDRLYIAKESGRNQVVFSDK